MKHIITKALAVGLLCSGLGAAAFTGIPAQVMGAARVAGAAAVLSPDDSAVLQANGMLVRAFERDDTATVARLLDADFTWIDAHGVLRSREEVLQGLPPIAAPAGAEKPGTGAGADKLTSGAGAPGGNSAGSVKDAAGKSGTMRKPASGIWSDAKVTEHTYGTAGVILVARGKTHILRVWVKRPGGWRLLHINEINQLAQAPAGDAAVPSEAGVVTPCINPCKSAPFTPATPAEQAAFSSWQAMETGSAVRDMDAWGREVTEDCLIVDSAGSDPLSKADRIAKTLKQKQNGVQTNEAVPLVMARMFDFGDTVMMVSEHQPYGGKPYWATRLWSNRDGNYQMFVSFHTTIEDVPAFALSGQLPDK
jgi:hypothetical protein